MDSAVGNAPPEFSEAWSVIRNSTGLDASVKCLLGASLHGAKTDSVNVEFSESFIDKCIPENYHGFADPTIASSGTAFVIGHEVGHLTVHPGKFSDWGEEMKTYPCSPGQQGMWSNVLSDIIVNYHITRAYNWIGGKPPENPTPRQQKILLALAQGRRWEILNRECGARGREDNINRHADLLVSGALTDNRYNGGKYTNHESGNEYQPTRSTPIYETRQGHGRGIQYYPPLSYACSQSLPENYRKVENKEPVYSRICGTTNKSFSWMDNLTQSPWGGSVTSGPYLSPGTHVVTDVKSYDGRINYSEPWPAYEYKINGNWYPAQYFHEKCPDCGSDCAGSWITAFRPRPQDKPTADHNFLYRMLLVQEFAANYAEDGYAGLMGDAAANQWFKDVGWAMHVAYQEIPPI